MKKSASTIIDIYGNPLSSIKTAGSQGQRHNLITQTDEGVLFLNQHLRTINASAAAIHRDIYPCVTRIATDVANINWSIVAKKGEKVKEEVLISANNAIKKPFRMTEPQFKYWIALNMAMNGFAPIRVTTGYGGKKNGAIALKALSVERVFPFYRLDSTANQSVIDRVGYYDYESKQETYYPLDDFLSEDNTKFSSEYVTTASWVNLSPDKWYNGWSKPLDVIGLPAYLSNLLLFRSVELAEGKNTAPFLLSLPENIDDHVIEDFEKQLKERTLGGSKVGSPLAAAFGHVTKVDLIAGIDDVHNRIASNDMSATIARVFGVPNAILGLRAEGSSKASTSNSEVDITDYLWNVVIGRYVRFIEATFNKYIVPEGCELVFDIENIPALMKERNAEVHALAAIGVFTINEMRAKYNLPPRSDGDVYTGAKPSSNSGSKPDNRI